MRWVEMHERRRAAHDAQGSRLGEHLVGLRKLSEEEVYRALGTQAGIPLGAPPHYHVSRKAARTLPAEMAKRGVSCPIAW